jgi:ABC-type Co2+ transport system permease subunit
MRTVMVPGYFFRLFFGQKDAALQNQGTAHIGAGAFGINNDIMAVLDGFFDVCF